MNITAPKRNKSLIAKPIPQSMDLIIAFDHAMLRYGMAMKQLASSTKLNLHSAKKLDKMH